MKYLVVSEREVLGKSSGDFIEEKELLSAGVNIQALVDGGHITTQETKIATSEGVK